MQLSTGKRRERGILPPAVSGDAEPGSARLERRRPAPRRADPYQDLDVIDSWAPRFTQAVIGTLALVSFLTGWWPLLALLAGQLVVGLTLGRRWCLPCAFYFEVVQRLAGEGPLEDARPPRFANLVGAAVLGAASVAHASGFSALGWTLGLLVAGLALAAAATGFCIGCEVYRLVARIRGVEICAECAYPAPGGKISRPEATVLRPPAS